MASGRRLPSLSTARDLVPSPTGPSVIFSRSTALHPLGSKLDSRVSEDRLHWMIDHEFVLDNHTSDP